MKILILNQDWFADEFRALGHEVCTCGTAEHLNVVLPTPCLHIETIIKEHLDGFRPDLILWLDNSAPLFTIGLDDTDILTVFYSVDTHHHSYIHRFLAHIFDLSFIAQKDYLKEFEAVGSEAFWLPLWASRHVEASESKTHGAVFVGNLNAKLNPDRVAFFEALKKEVPILATTGEYWKIFPFSEIVVNQTVKGDLNFRVFETMMCGALLLTEYAPNGLFEIFKEGVHLVTYEKNNVQSAAQKIRELLADLPKTRKIAQAGREEVIAHHLPKHRAEFLLKSFSGLKKKNSNRKHFANAFSFSILARNIESMDINTAARSLVTAMSSLEEGLKKNEKMHEDIGIESIFACIRYDQIFSSTAGMTMIFRLADAYPDYAGFTLAKIRQLLNQGLIGEAKSLSEENFSESPEKIFSEAEKFVSSILASSNAI
ncbi:MAG: glycosyltransferase family 1 protein [SAR324 cluster bacterium]|uniref:Glycosyltransferase family 1 protein n=1 Tax=SAR324 cluster bacterium TaxID=2024889 RepID=A0A7X9FU34_9DELT|nr:glycosyltransferase family 1 protein [SAR324 cluster bacterium]